MKMKKFFKIFFRVLHILFIIALITALVVSIYIKIDFAHETLDEFIFYLRNGVKDADSSYITDALKKCWLPIVLLSILVIGFFYNLLITREIGLVSNKPIPKKKLEKVSKEKIVKRGRESFRVRQIYPFGFINRHRIIFTVLLTGVLVTVSLYNVRVFGYIENRMTKSDFIENNYVVSKERNTIFPEKKRNLIILAVESLETTFFTKEQGGAWSYEVMPELYNILEQKDTIFFSSNDKMGGILDAYGSTWTTASLVANTTGLPFKVPINGNDYHSDNFMNGAYALGDILKDQGYYTELISAATTSFGGLKEYFTKHGKYTIIDKDSLEEFGYKYTKDDYNPWGFNDNLLFKIAKDRLTKVSKEGKPFNETIVTIDTHQRNGYIGNYSVNMFDTQYENVYATTSKLIGEFISWVKKQDFYKDTTIVIFGDHLSMQADYFKNYDRNLRNRYNAIINSVVKTTNTKNRKVTAFDMYPTMLASIGVKFADDRLGLGVNLFSDKKTLAEEYGLDEMNKELEKNSEFYNKKILGSDYQKMVEE